MKPLLAAFHCLLLCLAMSCSVQGAYYYYWNAGDGDFNTSANWTANGYVNGYPGDFWIVNNNGTANITSDVPNPLFWILPGSSPSGSASATVGMVNQSAGVVNLNDRLLVAYNPDSFGVYNMTGGTLNANLIPGSGSSLGGSGGTGVMNVSGTAVFNATKGLTFGRSGGTVTNVLNLGVMGNPGGTVQASSLWTVGGTGLVNFHGGTYKPNLTYTDSLHNTTNVVYSEGAIIDTNGVTIGIQSPLVAPTGNGVLGFQLDASGSGYTSAPIVKIEAAEGDSGKGATALATIDPVSGSVTGLVITNPGTDYTLPPVVTLIGGGGTGGAISIPASSLGQSNSGGLTKRGLGTLNLTAPVTSWGITHTYTGPTVVEQGTLFIDGYWVTLNSSNIEVQNTATLSAMGTNPLPSISVKAGGRLDPGGGFDYSFSTSGLTLYDGAKLFIRTTASIPNLIDVQGDVNVGGTSGAIRVDFSGTTPTPGSYPLINYTGTLNSSLSFLLEYDSVGNSGAQVSTTAAPNQVTAIFTDLTSANRWNNGAGGSYKTSAASNWTDSIVPVSGNQRAIFADVSSASGDINVSLETNPALSSLLFNNGTYSYKIGSTTGNYFTLNSSIAFNNLISVIAGTHEINVPVKLNKNTRVQVDTGSAITLGSTVSEDVGGARTLTVSGAGTLKLLGSNTYSGATVMTGGGTLEVASVDVVANPNSLGKSSVTPANLVLDGTLRYIGSVDGSTDRGFTLAADTTIDTPDKNLSFAGQIVKLDNLYLYKTGRGALTFCNGESANTLPYQVQLSQGKMTFSGGANSVYNTTGAEAYFLVGDENTSDIDTPILDIQSGTLNIAGGLYVGGWVTSGATSTLQMTGGKISAGFLSVAAYHVGGTTKAVLNMSGDSLLAINANGYLNGDVSGARTTVTMSDHSELKVGTWLNVGAWGETYTDNIANVTLQDYAKVSVGVNTTNGLNLGVGGDSKAVWTLMDNATLNVGNLRVGRIQNASGAIYQYGGTFQGIGSGMLAFGGDLTYDATNTTYGYFALANGEVHAGNLQVLVGTTGTGVVDQTGGNFDANYSMLLGCKTGATGVYNLTAGALTMRGWNSIVGYRGSGVLNISGAAAFTHNAGTDSAFYVGYGGGQGIVNLGTVAATGGTVEVYQIARDGDASTGIVNFHGGTLKATASSPTSGSSDFLKGTTNYIYGEGAKIDTNGFDITITTDLKAPTGKGVQSIAFNPLTDGGEGYIGAPAVVITAAEGDSGVGATAKALFDPATGKVTGIVVTNPGVGYTGLPTVTLLGGGSTTPAAVGAVTLADNVDTGGLMKLGVGSLTLTGTLSYGGNTTVNEGTLNVLNVNTPSATISVATGATLNADSLVAHTLSIGGPPVVAAVPEPSVLMLIGLASVCVPLFARRWK